MGTKRLVPHDLFSPVKFLLLLKLIEEHSNFPQYVFGVVSGFLFKLFACCDVCDGAIVLLGE